MWVPTRIPVLSIRGGVLMRFRDFPDSEFIVLGFGVDRVKLSENWAAQFSDHRKHLVVVDPCYGS